MEIPLEDQDPPPVGGTAVHVVIPPVVPVVVEVVAAIDTFPPAPTAEEIGQWVRLAPPVVLHEHDDTNIGF